MSSNYTDKNNIIADKAGSRDDSEDDQTFQPPALSSYAMSLLNEINNKQSSMALANSLQEDRAYNFQPRLSTGGLTESKRYSATHDKTAGTTVDTKRTSMGHNNTTPYTAFTPIHGKGEEDLMEISPDIAEQKPAQVHFHVDHSTVQNHTPIQKHKKLPLSVSSARLSISDTNKNLRRFARVSLGAPRRITKKDLEEEQEEVAKTPVRDFKWLEEEKIRVHTENEEMIERLKSLEKKKYLERSPDLNKENLDARHENRRSPVQHRREVLSSISPNIEKNQRHHHHDESKSAGSPVVPKNRLVHVNGRSYEKLELIGKGGTSKVYKVKSTSNGKVYAIKRVVFDEFDDSAVNGFKGEIDILQKLKAQQRVVQLVEYSIMEGSLVLVMECGDIDLAHVLTSRVNMPLDISFVRYHAVEMLRCVAAVHACGVVHSDLKPANFIFVKGVLKLIDFGIASALSDHTMNVYRESQIGTPNYMSPESLLEVNMNNYANANSGTWKVGRASDVWSCGCIIYQMIYGRPPYASYSGNQRLLAIMNPQIKIAYPDTGLGDVKVPKTAIQTMQNCLQRDPTKRWTTQQLLEGPFCSPKTVSKEFVEDLVMNAINFGAKNGDISKESLNILTSEVWSKIEELSL